jgi:hypothetical protein
VVPDARAAALLDQLFELESRDVALGAQLESIDALAMRTAAVRQRALDVADALDALPSQTAAAEEAERSARHDERAAQTALAGAEERIASLGRRTSQDERDQAERELTRAREDLHDAGVRVVRATARIVELRELGQALAAQAEGLLVEARAIAAGIRESARVADAGKGEPGESLDSLAEWGARARAALFVAHSTLADERERVVLEANALGASVLGEELGGSSVALVRRRLEQALAPSPQPPR